MTMRSSFKRRRPAGSLLPGQAYSGRDLVLVPLLVVLGMLLYPVGASAAAGLTRVLITDPTNTSQQAHVDASGHLQVGGTVGAQQSGSWNVGIAGTPTVGIDSQANTVQLGNTLSDPGVVDVVSGPFRNAVQVIDVVTVPSGLFGGNKTIYTVPAGERLVITYASGVLTVPLGQRPVEAFVGEEDQGTLTFTHYLVPTETGQLLGEDYFLFSGPMAMEVAGGRQVNVGFTMDTDTGDRNGGFQISGYLIDCTTSLPCN
jgi:hypothetical protein